MWLGITEYLFLKPDLLDECIDTAIVDNTFRADDLEFTFAARVSHVIPSQHSLSTFSLNIPFPYICLSPFLEKEN